MGERNIKRAIRMILGAGCTMVALLLAMQYVSLRDTADAAQEARDLKERIGPKVEASVRARDQSNFDELTKSSLFGREPPPKIEPPSWGGRLGRHAILGGKMIEEGGKVDDHWTLKTLSDDEVVIVRMEGEREIKHQYQMAKSQGLVIDNRPKNKRKDITPAGVPAKPGAGPSKPDARAAALSRSQGASGAGAVFSPSAGGADGANSASWREQFEKMRQGRGGVSGSRAARGQLDAGLSALDIQNMTIEEIERIVRERNGGQLPGGFNIEEIQRRIKDARLKKESRKSSKP